MTGPAARRLGRRGRVPQEVRAVELGSGERLVSWAQTPDGPAVATSWRLGLPAPSVPRQAPETPAGPRPGSPQYARLLASGRPAAQAPSGAPPPDAAGSPLVWLDWDGIDKASWADPYLTVVAAGGGPRYRARLDPARDLPATVRARIGLAVVFSRRELLSPNPGGLRVVARRSPRSGQMRWEVVLDAGTDPDDPVVRERSQQALAAAVAELGGSRGAGALSARPWPFG